MREMTDLVCEAGAARTADVLVVQPHEVVHEQLAAPLEQVGQRELRSAWAVEDVRLFDLHHGEPPPLGVQRVALAREALLLLERLFARGEPLLAGDDLGEVRVHLKRTMARTSAPALSLAGALARRTRSPHREL